jgi:putative Ca2+/H+ antiporter (TMEM165/GDT1 family)
MRDLIVIFTTVFFAELGDKTQLATLLFASERKMPALLIFFAAAGALVASTALAVVVGETGQRYLTAIPLKLIAGLGFIAIGAWTVAQYYRGA